MKKYFVLDRGIIQPQGTDNVQLQVCPIVKDQEHNPLFEEDFFGDPPRRWEARFDNGYPNIIYDPKYKKYRLYFTVCTLDHESSGTSKEERTQRAYRPLPSRITSLEYAESEDGVHWIKPELSLVEFEGSKKNNLIVQYAHGTGVFLDEEERDERKRYKLVTKMEFPGGHSYMAVNFSEDGIHWGEMIPWPKFNPPADSHNFPFRDKKDGTFKVITRIWKNGVRLSALSQSHDFINWSEPREILRGDGFESQIYSMVIYQYERLYLGFASMFHEGDRSGENFDTVDCELKYATDPCFFDSVAKGQYVIPRGEGKYPTGDFDCGCIFASNPIEIDGKLWIYYMGGNGQHTNFRETSFARGYLEQDRFAYYRQRCPEKESVLVTSNFHICEDRVEILADLGEQGELFVAFYDSFNGSAYDGFDYSDCRLNKLESGWYSLTFSKSMMDLGVRSVCMKLRFRDARIYAIQGELENVSIRS